MGMSWSPFLAECCAWASVLHRHPNEIKLFDVDMSTEVIPKFVGLLDKNGDPTCGLATIMYDNVIIALRNKPDADKNEPEILRYADRILSSCKHLKVKVKQAEAYVPTKDDTRGEMLQYTMVADTVFCRMKRDKSGKRLPDKTGNPSILGVEFSSSETEILRWRHSSKRVGKANQMMQDISVWTPREVATRVGIIVWHCIVKQRRFGLIKDIIDALKNFHIETKSDWDKTIEHPGADWRDLCKHLLEEIKLNEWTHVNLERSRGSVVACASDASDTLLGGVLYNDNGEITTTFDGVVERDIHIFVKELMAAHAVIDWILKHTEETNFHIRIAVDNTAASRALNRGYSSNDHGNKLIMRLYELADARNISIEAIDIASEFNAGDCLTVDSDVRKKQHGHKLDGTVCGHRRFRTFEVLHGRMSGRAVCRQDTKPISKEKLMLANHGESILNDDWMSKIETRHCRLEEYADADADDEE